MLSLTVTTPAGGRVVEVHGTPDQGATGSVVTSLVEHGEDNVVVGDGSGHLSGVRGMLNVANAFARSSLTVDGSAEPGKQTVTISSTAISGLAPASVTFDANDLSMVDLMGGTGSNTFQIVGTRFRAPAGAFTAPPTELPVNIDGGAGSNTLIGPDVTDTWNVQSRDTGSVGDVTFTRVGNLTGGIQSDRFELSDGANLSGGIDGGLGLNTLDMSAQKRDVVVNLALGTATAIGGHIVNIAAAYGGLANSILVGDANRNFLIGGAGRNLLIGGGGPDQLNGGAGDNILIGGTTSYDLQAAALEAVMSEFARTDERFLTRLTHLLSGNGANDPVMLNPGTVQSDDEVNILTGGTGRNWFFKMPAQTSSAPQLSSRATSSRRSESNRKCHINTRSFRGRSRTPEAIAMLHPDQLARRCTQAHRRRQRPRFELLEDRRLLSAAVVTNTEDSGKGSLRNAILLADVVTSDIDTIEFAIPGPGVHTITPLSDLPAITAPIRIDGYTQPGSSTNTLADGDNAKITIELSGDGPGTTARNAFTVNSGGTTIRGLAINQFSGDAFAIAGASDDQIAGDFVGTDPTGTIAEGNATNGTATIQVDTSDVTIGGPSAADRTIVSASGYYGIVLSSGMRDQVQNCYVGTDETGKVALGNRGQGIFVAGASGITIGGTTAAVRNVISGNLSNAIGLATAGNVVEGNYVGTDSTGMLLLSNASDGIVVSVGGNQIGGTLPGQGNLISGNSGAGVLIDGSTAFAQGVVVQGNLIGTDKTGTLAIANTGSGIAIGGGEGGGYDDLIGGTVAAARNVISGNKGAGIAVASGTGNEIQGNYIGVDVTGNVALPNQAEGVNIYSSVTVGGFEPGSQNVISGNGGDGILIVGDGSDIENNLVGLGVDGSTPQGNGGNGVEAIGVVQIGGSFSGARNVISANKGDGIALGGGSTRPATIQDNFIGTDATGTQARGNKANGIYIGTAGTLVTDNVIAANGTRGDLASTTGGITLGNIGNGTGSADNNRVLGNLIGTAADGVSPLGNVGGGIIFGVGASNNSVAENTIAYNNTSAGPVGGGIAFEYSVNGATGNAIEGNSIFANTGLGIDLTDDGVTLNTPGGPHTGPNDSQNFPVLTSASSDGESTAILGTLNAAPSMTFTIEFFSNSTADPSGYGQGKVPYAKLTGVTTDSTGNASFSAFNDSPLPSGQFVTATATDPAGNTSEFSQDFPVSAPSPLIVTTTNDSGPGSLRAAILYANANTGTGAITFDISGTGVQTITPQSPLPAITVPVTIDGYSQPGAAPTRWPRGLTP